MLSTGVVPVAVAPQAATAAPPVPVPGNAFLEPSDWMALHNGYAARARRGGNPVVVLGDSLVYLWGDPHRKAPIGMMPPTGQASWVRSLGTDRAANFGIIDDSTANLLWRVQNGELRGHPRVAVVLIGANDLLTGRTPEQTAAGVAAVAVAIRSASPRTEVLLLGLLPALPDPANPLRAEARRVNERISGLAGDHVHVLDVSGHFVNPDGTFVPGLLEPVGIHLTAEGYRVLSDAVQPAVRQLLATAATPSRQPRAERHA
jgi:lysophospholipase L1-like esterase